jgi:hypothetical protein
MRLFLGLLVPGLLLCLLTSSADTGAAPAASQHAQAQPSARGTRQAAALLSRSNDEGPARHSGRRSRTRVASVGEDDNENDPGRSPRGQETVPHILPSAQVPTSLQASADAISPRGGMSCLPIYLRLRTLLI